MDPFSLSTAVLLQFKASSLLMSFSSSSTAVTSKAELLFCEAVSSMNHLVGSWAPRKKICFKSAVCITLILEGYRKAAAEGRNWKDNTVYDSEAKFTTTKDLPALFIGQTGTTALKSLMFWLLFCKSAVKSKQDDAAEEMCESQVKTP